ncbi:glycosyltransferase family 2 protein [Aquimarina rubra]|uniref:Glycosyltransferase family 2 protein n=1 Tax=Aquimarina rubra TaxID=1920033 RepID=A0ABW5LMH0_9FLAO
MPLFSIIIPLYNKEKHIANTIQSALDQIFTDYELIIINDGSTDGSEKIVKRFNDNRIHYFYTENTGVSNTRNLGIEKSNGKLIAFLDADDFWYPNHLEILSRLFKKFPNAGLYSTSYEKRFNQKSVLVASFKNVSATSKSFKILDDFFESSSIDSIASSSVSAVPKNVLISLNGFDPKITHGEDTDLWIRIALKHKVAFATYITAVHNLDASNRSKQVQVAEKKFLNFSKFKKEELTNPSLKKYLDSNRHSIALQYRAAGDFGTAKKYSNNIDYKNLSWKHRFLIRQPRVILIILKKIQITITDFFGIHLSSFK